MVGSLGDTATERVPYMPVNQGFYEFDVISRVEVWAGGKEQAISWYEAQPIPALGGQTAATLVREGRVAVLREYLDHVEQGGFS